MSAINAASGLSPLTGVQNTPGAAPSAAVATSPQRGQDSVAISNAARAASSDQDHDGDSK